MRTPRERDACDGYARPHERWHCGLADEGPPCPLGPDGRGVCPAAAACHPAREGDRWLCNRSPLRGGPCAQGPDPDGACAVVQRCTPVRALRSRRGRFVGGVLAAACGAALMALSGPWRNAVVAPGPLTAHHAHLVEHGLVRTGCATCHPRGGETTASWVGVGSSVAAATQTSLCMKCHENSFSADLAAAAHNAPLDRLTSASSEDRVSIPGRPRRDPSEPIACAACHREHHGRKHDLSAISDAACQACHRERFASFTDGHPEFHQWPDVRRTPIMFDHASHAQKHHPANQHEFACAKCHEADSSGDHQLTRSYEATCAECHDKALAVSVAAGVPMLAAPTLDLAALADAGHAVAPWPVEADGDFDGKAPVPALLLASADEPVANAVVALGGAVDFFDVDPDDPQQLAAAATLAAELRELAEDLADRGRDAIGERLSAVLGREATLAELDALVAQLSALEAQAYRDRWFGASGDANAGQGTRRGAWSNDKATLSLRYHPAGHADAWLKAWLDVLAEAATGPRAAVAEPLLRTALAPTAPGQCGSCHSVERDSDGRFAVQWRAFAGNTGGLGLTHFSHRAHVLQSQLRDCSSCHALAAADAARHSGDHPQEFSAGFARLTKANCVACHNSAAAGANCTLCHRYHSAHRALGGGP